MSEEEIDCMLAVEPLVRYCDNTITIRETAIFPRVMSGLTASQVVHEAAQRSHCCWMKPCGAEELH
jgi:hypothetical protein